MTNLAQLLQNPELARNIKIEVTGKDLLSFASALIDQAKHAANKTADKYLTSEEVQALVRRDRTTLHRWHNNGTLKHNQLGLYKEADVLKMLETK